MTVKGVYNKLNLITGEVEGEQVSVEFGMGDIPDSGESFPFAGGGNAGSEANSQSYDYLAMNYVLTAKARSTIDVSVTTDNANVKPIDVTQVPVERNWRTNIYGSLLTGGNAGTEIIPDNLIEISTADELKSALAQGDSIILKDNLEIILNGDNESIAVFGKNYLFLNGKTLTVRRINHSNTGNRCAFSVSGDGTSLTIVKGTLDLSDYGGDIMLNSANTSITVNGVTLNFPLTKRYCGIRQGANVLGVSINITDSNLHSSFFCVYTDYTNATTSKSTTEITIQRSILMAEVYGTILNCVNGNVNISDSKLYGATQGLIMRGGTAIIDNSLIQIDTDKWTDTRNAYTGSTWDDDAEVWMPREDYDRFLDYCQKNKDSIAPYKLSNRQTEENYYFGISRFSDRRYKYIHTNNEKPIDIGVFVDVYPLDFYGENVAQAKKILKHIQKENRKIRIYVNGKGNSTIKSCLKIPYHLLLQVVYGRDYLKKFDLEIVEYIHENTKNTNRYVGIRKSQILCA